MKHLLMLLLVVALAGCASLESDPVQVTFPLSYTAPGDDDYAGQATLTQIRMAMTNDSLADHWDSCAIISEHIPALGGIFDTVTVVTETETEITYYIAAKSVDEKGNWSGLSNIITRNWPDITPPMAIQDLSFAD